MSAFAPALDFLLDSEDRPRRYNEVIDNNGGKVIAGINSKSYPEQEAAIASASQEKRSSLVYQFYFVEFWLPLKLGYLNSQDVANRVLDASVNMGQVPAIRLLQQAVGVAADGHIGPVTLAAANVLNADALLASYREQRSDYYRKIVAAKPEDEKYLKNWLARANA